MVGQTLAGTQTVAVALTHCLVSGSQTVVLSWHGVVASHGPFTLPEGSRPLLPVGVNAYVRVRGAELMIVAHERLAIGHGQKTGTCHSMCHLKGTA